MADFAELDVTIARRKIMDPEEGQGWDMEYTAHVENRYAHHYAAKKAGAIRNLPCESSSLADGLEFHKVQTALQVSNPLASTAPRAD